MEKQLKNTKWCGKERRHFAVIDSTNKKAKELAQAGCAHGTLVTAESQQAGIGRRGRSWSSEQGTGIYMSLVLRPDIKTENASSLTLVAAISGAKAIAKLLNTEAANTFGHLSDHEKPQSKEKERKNDPVKYSPVICLLLCYDFKFLVSRK